MSAPLRSLESQHLKALQASAICDSVIAERGYRSITNRQELLVLGFSQAQARVPGLLVPILGPGEDVTTYSYRPDNPRTIKGGKEAKYEFPPNSKPRLDVPARARQTLRDVKVPLWITEGSKKADSAVSRGLCCVAVAGVWNWKAKTGEGGSVTLGDFEQLPLKGRTVYLAFDSDAWTKTQVQNALKRFAGFLESKGASVQVVRIPSVEGEKVGLDDYFANGGTVDHLLTRCVENPSEDAEDSKGKPDNCGALLDLLEKEGVEAWHDADKEAYVTYCEKGTYFHSRIDSQPFRTYLSGIYYRATKRGLSDVVQSQVLSTLAAKARHEGEEYPTALRIGSYGSTIYLHLADAQNRVVKIRADGWSLIGPKESKIRFITQSAMRALPEPDKFGSLSDIREFVNVDGDGLILVEAFLLSCFLSSGTFPMLLVSGEQGSGKTFACGKIRSLIDPAKSPTRLSIRDMQALGASASNNFVLCLDNLSNLPAWLSDAFCAIASGVGLDDRKLYTNNEEVSIHAKRPLILNGITDFAARADLLDRSITLELRRLSGEGKSENDLDQRFEELRAGILGDLLDRVSTALSNYETTIVPGPHRLHDSVRFVLASVPDGPEREAIWRVLAENRLETQTAAVDNDSFAQAVIKEVEGLPGQSLHATSQEIFLSLKVGLSGARIPKDWPQSDKAVSNKLTRIAPALRLQGYDVERDEKRSSKGLRWRIEKRSCCKQPSLPSLPSLSVAI